MEQEQNLVNEEPSTSENSFDDAHDSDFTTFFFELLAEQRY